MTPSRRSAPVVLPVAAVAAVALVLAGCSGASPAGPAAPATTSTAPSPSSPSGTAAPAPDPAPPAVPAELPSGVPGEPRTLASGLSTPWSVVPLADGGALVSERDTARVVRVGADGRLTPLTATGRDGAVEGVTPRGEGGLLGLALAPGADPLAGTTALYAFTTTADDGRVVVMDLDLAAGTLGAPRPVITGFPSERIHHGGRIAFGPDGSLHIATGDAGDRSLSQDLDSLGGKVLRVTADGSPDPDNPDPASPVLTTGHRNVQGLGWDSSGRLFASEFGQDEFDELNLLTPGGDHGWPEVEGFAAPEDAGTGTTTADGFVEPLVTWAPEDASPSGVVVTADAVYLAALRGQRLWRVPLTGADAAGAAVVGEPEAFVTGELGRIRDVVLAPAAAGGGLWVITDDAEDGRLVHLPLV